MKPLTERQKAVLAYIERFTGVNGYPPTVRETAAHFKISPKGAQDHIAAIAKKGYITRSRKARAITVCAGEAG